MKAGFARSIGLITAALALFSLAVGGTAAQDDDQPAVTYPPAFTLTGFTHIYQTWNNCGPATLTMGLTFFGYPADQVRAANWLKPNYEDKNVSPWQMVEFVNTQIPEYPVYALVRYGGTLDTLRMLLNNRFPVIIESGYDPASANQGWMGHYLLVVGYDDAQQTILTQDSYDGPNLAYTYEHIEEFWQHFNYTYIVLYESGREPELLELLGSDADPAQNALNAALRAREQAIADNNDMWAWFNMGSSLALMGLFEDAALAYDQSTRVGEGWPWRVLWYQFGPLESYIAVGRYNEVLTLVNRVRNDGGGQYVEETLYYAGLAREGLGETQRAIENYRGVLAFNPNFHPARERLEALGG